MKAKPSSSVVHLNAPLNIDASIQFPGCMMVSHEVKNFLPLRRSVRKAYMVEKSSRRGRGTGDGDIFGTLACFNQHRGRYRPFCERTIACCAHMPFSIKISATRTEGTKYSTRWKSRTLRDTPTITIRQRVWEVCASAACAIPTVRLSDVRHLPCTRYACRRADVLLWLPCAHLQSWMGGIF